MSPIEELFGNTMLVPSCQMRPRCEAMLHLYVNLERWVILLFSFIPFPGYWIESLLRSSRSCQPSIIANARSHVRRECIFFMKRCRHSSGITSSSEKIHFPWAWWYMPLILALWRQGQADLLESKASMVYTVISRSSRAIW